MLEQLTPVFGDSKPYPEALSQESGLADAEPDPVQLEIGGFLQGKTSLQDLDKLQFSANDG